MSTIKVTEYKKFLSKVLKYCKDIRNETDEGHSCEAGQACDELEEFVKDEIHSCDLKE
jgi:hypothetical protein